MNRRTRVRPGGAAVASSTFYVWCAAQSRWNEMEPGMAARLSDAGYTVRLLSKGDTRRLRRSGVRFERAWEGDRSALRRKRDFWRRFGAVWRERFNSNPEERL